MEPTRVVEVFKVPSRVLWVTIPEQANNNENRPCLICKREQETDEVAERATCPSTGFWSLIGSASVVLVFRSYMSSGGGVGRELFAYREKQWFGGEWLAFSALWWRIILRVFINQDYPSNTGHYCRFPQYRQKVAYSGMTDPQCTQNKEVPPVGCC